MAEVVTSQNLIMEFESVKGNAVKLTLKDAADNLDAEAVALNMDAIIGKNVFQYEEDDLIEVAKAAKVRKIVDDVLFTA